MRKSDLQRFARRDWQPRAASRLAHWAREFEQHGSRTARRAATVLWQHMRAIRPDYPSPDERAADFDHHVTMRRRIDRVNAFTGR